MVKAVMSATRQSFPGVRYALILAFTKELSRKADSGATSQLVDKVQSFGP
jgi:hypothetical protein